MFGPQLSWGRSLLPARLQRPPNHRLPVVYRLSDAAPEPAGEGELARDVRLALLEAALLIADEPLTTRRLATVAGLKDGTEARQLVKRLHELYEKEGSAFQ